MKVTVTIDWVLCKLKNLLTGFYVMKDGNGIYYYPFPDNKATRMYVREENGVIYFRLWNSKDPKLWEEHGWIDYDAILQASAMYDKKNFDPGQAYDLAVAKALVREEKSKKRS